MQKYLPHSPLQQQAELASPTTNCPRWFCCIFGDLPSLRGALVPIWDAPEISDVQKWTVYIWKYADSIILWRYLNDPRSNFQCRAQNQVQSDTFARFLLIAMIYSRSDAVHLSDVDRFMLLFAGEMIGVFESRVLTEMDAIDCIAQNSCDAGCKIQLHCRMLFTSHFALQLPVYLPSPSLDQGYMSDQASGGQECFGWE